MKKLLIIEDEAAISMALEDDFRLEGYDVTVARDGKRDYNWEWKAILISYFWT